MVTEASSFLKCYEDVVRRVLDSVHKKEFTPNNFLTGKLLVAMPFMGDLKTLNILVFCHLPVSYFIT